MSDPIAATIVIVRTGNQEIKVPAGLTVSQIREQLSRINISTTNATAYAGNNTLGENDAPTGGSTISFIAKMGEKG